MKKRSIYGIMMPVNDGEIEMIKDAATASGRSVRQFVKVAAIKQAIHVLQKVKEGERKISE